MTSTISGDIAMLVASSASSRNVGTGRINNRIVPNNPTTSQRSPCFNNFATLDFAAAILVYGLVEFGVIAVTIDAIDPGQNLRDRRVELRRDFRADSAIFKHQPGQR